MGQASQLLMRRVRKEVMEWDTAKVQRDLADGERFALVDVRETTEWNEGHLPDALHVPRGFLELRIEEAVPDKDQPVVLYCASGVRSLLAAETLKQLGYRQPVSLAGGYNGWKNAGLPTVLPRTLGDEQRKRYSRHLLVPEVGEAGPLNLLDAKVLLLGAGGPGAPPAPYLAAGGGSAPGPVEAGPVRAGKL